MDEPPPIFVASIPADSINIYHKFHNHLTDPAHVLDIFATVLLHNSVRIFYR